MANKKVSQLVSKPSVLVTDLFPIADPTTGQLYKTTISDLGTAIGSGVSSVNTLVGAVVLDTDDIQELASPTNRWFTDTRARAAVSASSPLAYNSGTGVFSIPAATSSQNGYLTSTDWTTFNAKQTALSGTGFVKISGTTISYDNSTYALDSAVVKLTGNQTIAGVKTFTTGIVADVTTGGTQGFASTNSSTSGSSIFLQNNSTSVGNAIGINNTSTADGISIGNDTSGRAIYISNATASGSGKGISIDNYNSGIGIEVGSDSTADAIKVLHLSGRAFNIQSSGGGYGVIINNTTASTSAPFTIQKQGANRITFTDAGAGTFVSTISAAGATLTGALSGTSATFSGVIRSDQTNGLALGSVSGYRRIQFDNSTTTFGFLNDSNALANIAVAGATFSSSVTATGLTLTTGASTAATINSTGTNVYSSVSFNNTTTGYGYDIGFGGSASIAPNSFYVYGGSSASVKFLINSSGNVGIGTTTPATFLHVLGSNTSARGQLSIQSNNASNAAKATWYYDTFNSGEIGTTGSDFYALATNNFQFYAGGAERMRITSGGYLKLREATLSTTAVHILRADTTSDAVVQVTNENTSNASDGMLTVVAQRNTTNNTFYAYGYYNIGASAWKFRVADSGNVTNTNNSYGAISDIKLKENISDATSKLADLLKIKVKNYNFIGSNEKQLGVIAQDVEEIFPGLVETNKDTDRDGNDLGTVTKSVKYSVFVPMLIKAVQELSDKIITLENK